jgi:serine/threonine protein kinase
MVGRYRLIELLGVGGMGVVYLAEDPELDRLVAIKLLRPDLWGGTEADALQREARAMARVSHPNVVQVYDAGAAHDQLFLAMEYVDGLTLRGWLQEQPRSVSEILSIAQQAGKGLAAAHRAGLIHRDLFLSQPPLPTGRTPLRGEAGENEASWAQSARR